MTWRRVALLPMLVALCACAEGGTRGSGISTSVLGNVVDIGPTAAAQDLAGIRVAIEGTDVGGETDASGAFSLSGDFEGMVTLLFELADGGGEARIDLNVPAAGMLTLNDVRLDPALGVAVAASANVDFAGVVYATDCAAGTLIMDSAQQPPGDVDHYLVDLATSTIEDAGGNPVPCAALAAGDQASLQGSVEPDGSFGHAVIVLQE